MLVCPSCQAPNQEQAPFCERCGSPLSAAAAAVRTAIEKNTIALGLASQGKLNEALDAVNEAIRLAPGHGPSYRNRADIFERMGMTAQATVDRDFASRLGTPQPMPQSAADDATPLWWDRTGRDTVVSYAGFWIRLLAAIIDGIVLLIPQVLTALMFDDLAVRVLANLIVGIIYTVSFWMLDGATPGKMAVGVKIVKSSGDRVGFGTAVVRYLGYYVSSLTLLVGYLMIAFTRDKRGLHDLIAGTVVVKTR